MKVLFFGIAKDIVGKSELDLSDVDALPSSVRELKDFLTISFPEFGKLSSLAVAVNNEYAYDGLSLGKADEIAVIPPVSGG